MPYAWEVEKKNEADGPQQQGFEVPPPAEGANGPSGHPGLLGQQQSAEIAVQTGPDGSITSVSPAFKAGDVVRLKGAADGKKSANAFRIEDIKDGTASGLVVSKGATKGARQSAKLEELELAPNEGH